MINRILIRTKVVQMLYAYLLTRSEFRIALAPDTASRDKKYAYSLYLDLILLVLELSGYNVENHPDKKLRIAVDPKLASTKMAKALAADDDIKAVILKGTSHVSDFNSIAQSLHDTIVDSAAFKDYKKIKSPELKDDIKLWNAVLNTIFAKDSRLEEKLRENPAFTVAGKDQAIAMVTETLVNYNDSRVSLSSAREDLQKSLDKAYELYVALFALIIDLTELQRERLETAKTKFLATPEDLNPNTRFIDNALAARLASDEVLAGKISDLAISWKDDPTLLRDIMDEVLNSEIYAAYMNAPSTDYASDCEFWREIIRHVVLNSPALDEALENKSIFWNDDLNIMGTFVLKTLKQMSLDPDNEKKVTLLPKYKDEEDAQFGAELFQYGVKNYDLYRSYIDRFINTKQWDADRMAFMDIVIMITAISELINYPLIPIAVTMNEYIEIANSYSTQRSGQFVNGILYSVANYLRSQGIISKE